MPQRSTVTCLALSACLLAAGCDYLAYDALHDRVDVADAGSCATGFAECDGSAQTHCETNLTLNPKHCGWCGHACGPASSCRAGLCDPVEVSTGEVEPQGLYIPPGAYSNRLFFTAKKGAQVRGVMLATGVVTTIAHTGRTPTAAGRVRMAIGWNWIYWVNSAEGTLWRVAAIGLDQQAEQIIANDVVDVSLSVSYLDSSGVVHHGDAQQGTWSVGGTFAGATSLAGAFAQLPTSIASIFGGASYGPPGGLASLSASEGHVFWGDSAGTLWRAGGNPWPPSTPESIATGQAGARAVVEVVKPDDASVVLATYWIAGGTGPGTPGEIWASDPRIAGGAPTKLTDLQATELAANATDLYFLDSTTGLVMRIAR